MACMQWSSCPQAPERGLTSVLTFTSASLSERLEGRAIAADTRPQCCGACFLTEPLLCAQKDDPWTVRVLPKVYFGVHPLGLDGVGPDDPDIVVLHHFLGSWKVRGGWSGGLGIGALLHRAAGLFTRRSAADPCVPRWTPLFVQD